MSILSRVSRALREATDYANTYESQYKPPEGDTPDASHLTGRLLCDIAAEAAGKLSEALPADHPLVNHPLVPVLFEAVLQAACGKGERHGGNTTPFLEQRWVTLAATHGVGFLTGQADKKIGEAAAAHTGERFVREVLGGVVYAGMAVLKERGKA